jgi:prepilin peptidase CpaA
MELDTNTAVLTGAYALYVGLLAVAAATDLGRFIIPNLVSLALILLLVALGLYFGRPLAWWGLHLGAGALLLLVGYLAWMLRFFGAGDVKLLAAVALFPGVGQVHVMLIYIALAGGVLALGLIVLRRVIYLTMASWGASPAAVGSLPRILIQRERVPYGVAISAGAILAGDELFRGFSLLN